MYNKLERFYCKIPVHNICKEELSNSRLLALPEYIRLGRTCRIVTITQV
jgi:hypothetical protein